MVSNQKLGFRLNTRCIIYGIVVWWLAMLIVFTIITYRSDRHKDRLKASGIAITNEFSELVSLPLLEKNNKKVHNLLTDAANKKNVIYASVVDHRNKVVAFTGTGHLLPDLAEADQSVEKVSILEGGFASHARFLNFASDINYAGTKIGEIFIGLSTSETYRGRGLFIILAVSSCLVLLVLILVFRYKSIGASLMKAINFSRSKSSLNSNLKNSLVACPLCGTHKQLSDKVFHHPNLGRLSTPGNPVAGPNNDNVTREKRINLDDIAKIENLSWMRRRIIERCTEIIKKLAT
jgi:hypothetical protein